MYTGFVIPDDLSVRRGEPRGPSDLRVGVGHLRAWKRIALVTDPDGMNRLSAFFGWTTPGETKAFPLAVREEALARVAG